MHSREMVELAALASAHGPLMIEHVERLPDEGIERYWTASKCRLDRWSRELKDVAGGKPILGHRRQGDRSPLRPLLEEVLAGEVLTRVWAGVLTLFDRRHGQQDAEPIARSVLLGHTEVRIRALSLLVDQNRLSTKEAFALDRLRRRAERWTDLLVGHLSVTADASEFAFHPARASEFAEELRGQQSKTASEAWNVTLAALRSAFATSLSRSSPNADLNAEIARSVVSCFEPSLFESTGMFRSLWLMRLASFAGDAQGMIDELFAAESNGAAKHAAAMVESQEAFLRRRRY
ncbi:MAG: hypothetical protein KF708_11320 [Pirellulales bacterium]|nr:hypothetical protein [Pirellulales bacterium]